MVRYSSKEREEESCEAKLREVTRVTVSSFVHNLDGTSDSMVHSSGVGMTACSSLTSWSISMAIGLLAVSVAGC